MLYLDTNSYNIEVARIFGVCTSVMLSCLFKEYAYQQRNKLLNANNTMAISRQEIYEKTGLDDDKQRDVELSLQECGVLVTKPLQNVPNKNYYILNEQQLTKIMTANNPAEVLGEAKASQFTLKHRVEPISKRQSKIVDLKKKIKVNDPIIQQYLIDWIDAVYTNPKGFLSGKAVEIAQQELYAYCEENKDNGTMNQAKAIAVLTIAIKNGWRDLSWAIDKYEEKNGVDPESRNFNNYRDTKSVEKNESGEVY